MSNKSSDFVRSNVSPTRGFLVSNLIDSFSIPSHAYILCICNCSPMYPTWHIDGDSFTTFSRLISDLWVIMMTSSISVLITFRYSFKCVSSPHAESILYNPVIPITNFLWYAHKWLITTTYAWLTLRASQLIAYSLIFRENCKFNYPFPTTEF